MLSIGLMSGTSMDGIDAALLETDGESQIKELGHVSNAYSPSFKIALKAAEYAIRQSAGDLDEARKAYWPDAIYRYLIDELKIPRADVDKKINALGADSPTTLDALIQHSTNLHAMAVKKLLAATGFQAQQIDVLGYHGQAMFHQPSDGISIIIGDGQALAEQVGITVVNDFRSRDIAAGGQGAPLAPLYHQALLRRDNLLPAAVVNCGGIANLTLIDSAEPLSLIAFDTGPGNGLIDRLVRQRSQGKEHMDTNGQYGQQGRVNPQVLKALAEKTIIKNGQNYFTRKPPKALDIGDMTLIAELDALSLEDACATLEAFTASTIVNSLELIQTKIPQHWILAGGGWNNPVIYRELEKRLHRKYGDQLKISPANNIGWNSQALEAQLFAYLAVRSLHNKPLSVPGTTGVPKPLSGGRTYAV